MRRWRRTRLVELYGWPEAGMVGCWLCELVMMADEFTVDRVVPGVLGGTYALDNCRPACRPCNLSRGGLLGAQRAQVGFPCRA